MGQATAWTSALPGIRQMWEATRKPFGTAQLPVEQGPRPQIFPPEPPRSRAEREGRVRHLELNMPRLVTMRAGQQTAFSAVAVDDDGNAIQGLPVSWESSDQSVVFIRPNGQVRAGNPGRAQIKARAGNRQELVQVIVLAAALPTTVPSISQNLRRSEKARGASLKSSNITTQDTLSGQQAHGTNMPTAMPQQGSPNLPQGDVPTLYERRNAVGSPPNRYFPSASTPPAADRNGREMPGSDNYSFSVPITNLPGRGIDVSLSLNYNSSLWHKTGSFGNNLTFDVDKSWPAPGFQLGYGHLSQQNNDSYELVDPDGTRHELIQSSPYGAYPLEYTSTDGTFIHAVGNINPIFTYTDGTQVYYGASSYNGTLVTYYPTRIVERHGNYLSINYQVDAYGNQSGPRITSITDTLGRTVLFKYDTVTGDLVTITAPGYANGSERQEVRFYYDTITDFTNSAKFASGITVNNRPSSIKVIKYIYFPGTQMGYRYDYSPYGMIRQITQLRGMTGSATSPNQTGQITSEGQVAATTTYNYPTTTPGAGLTAAPTYTQRADDWAGRTSSVPVTTFEVGATIKITAPDGSYSETTSDETSDTTEIKRTSQLGVTTVYARTKILWGTDPNQQNRRIEAVQSTIDADQPTGKTRTISYTYTDYNNVDEIIEYDFNTAPDTPGPILRRTKTTYVTDPSFADRQAYINRRLVRLPTSVKVFAGTSNVPVSWVDYAYDGGTLAGYPHTGQDYITNYDESYDPYAPTQTECGWIADNPECPDRLCHEPGQGICCQDHWQCNQVPVYNPATAKRGDLTSVTAYADAANGTNASVDTMTYDITGNIITATANCCQQRSYTYTSAYQFAYPETVTSGASATLLTKTAVYDYNTGELRTATDENNQTMTLHYDPANLRLYETVRPDGGTTDIIYFTDQLFADPDATHMHSAVMTVTSLDASRTVRNWQFSDGRGNVARTFGENAGQGHVGATYAEYDVMGRVYRVSNPYYAVYGGGTDVNPTGLWTTYTYDALGRSTIVTLQDFNTVRADYAGVTTTLTDQAGKQRRQTVDVLGQIVQVDEPDSTGALTQSTNYLYDSMSNLVRISQGEQTRYFKYDSLGRLTHERQVEQNAPYLQADALTGNNYWSRKYAYNTYNLPTDSWDARGIQKHATYDGLNRISQITYIGEAPALTPAVTYTYDESRTGYFNKGRLTSLTTAAVTNSMANAPQTTKSLDYDRMGRVASQRQTIGTSTYSLGYSYNLLDQLQSETYPSGRVVSRSYDAAARQSNISDVAQTYANNFVYTGSGGLSSETWGNGAVHTLSYNNRLQVAQIKLMVGGAEKQRFDYQYGEVNIDAATLNISPNNGLDTSKNTGQVAVIEGSIDGVRQWQQRYAYDKLGRLSTAKELTDNQTQTGTPAWRVDYTYDRYGNRYQGAGQGGIPVSWDDINRTNNHFVSNTSTLMIYDAAGDLTIDQKFRGLQYTYDANGRMRRTDASNNNAISVYDALGQRVQFFDALSNVTRQVVYDNFGQIVSDYENGVWKRDYIYSELGSSLLATIEASGGARYFLTDHQGSTRLTTNGSGQVISRNDYRPFGEELGASVGLRTTAQGYSTTNSPRQQYSQTERESTGLDHAWFRKLDSLSGKWTSPDPYLGSMSINDPQSLNRYSYVDNDPVNLTDPSGLWWAMSCHTYCSTGAGGKDPQKPLCVHICDRTWVQDVGSGMGGGGGFVHYAHGGGGSRIGGQPDQQGKGDPNSEYCKRLARRIANIQRDITEGVSALIHNPNSLAEFAATGKAKDDVTGHRDKLLKEAENLADRIKEYMDNCGGGSPPTIPLRQPESFRSESTNYPNGYNRTSVSPALVIIGVGAAAILCVAFAEICVPLAAAGATAGAQ